MSELKDDMSNDLLVVKKEMVPPFLPPKKTQLNLTVKTPISRKRKPFDAWDIENIGTEEALMKLISFSASMRILVFFSIQFYYLFTGAPLRLLIMSLAPMRISKPSSLK